MMRKTLSRGDLVVASALVVLMAVAFTIAGGKPLVVTFVVGLVGVAVLLVAIYRGRNELPLPLSYYPIFFGALAWQFIHFAEEFRTGFGEVFPPLYGGEPFSAELFVTINMVSYFVFAVSCVLVLSRNIRFLVAPMLFYVVYGAIGNAIAHTWWVIWLGEYFPGFFSAQLYWILGPLALSPLIGSLSKALVFTAGFAVVLIAVLTVFIEV